MLASGWCSGVNRTRDLLYLIARLLGDVNAVQKGKVSKRLLRRLFKYPLSIREGSPLGRGGTRHSAPRSIDKARCRSPFLPTQQLVD